MQSDRRQIIQTGLAASGAAVLSACASSGSGGAGHSVAPSLTSGQTSTAASSLHALAQTKGMRFGSVISGQPATRPTGSIYIPGYARVVEAECGIVVAENEFKQQALRPGINDFDFSVFDAMLAWSKARNMAMRGHTLLWHKARWMPAWSESHNYGASPSREAERIIKTHITTLLERYKGQLTSLDVVNEAVAAETGEIENTALSRAYGDPARLIDLCFHTAREQAPSTELVYNDYMSWEPNNEKHRTGVLRLLEGFKARGVPVDALGVQSHIGAFSLRDDGVPQHDPVAWRRFLDEVVGMGYGLVITEMDVRDDKFPTDAGVRDRAIASYARDYLEQMLSYRQLKDILFWGMVDKYSWLQDFEGKRPDGTEKRPCPYDSDLQPKLLRAAIEAAITSASPR